MRDGDQSVPEAACPPASDFPDLTDTVVEHPRKRGGATASSSRSSGERLGSLPRVRGEVVGVQTSIAPASDLEAAVCNLRELAKSTGKLSAEAHGELLDAWMSVEHSLLPDEVQELRSAVFARLFADFRVPVERSRTGSAAVGGR